MDPLNIDITQCGDTSSGAFSPGTRRSSRDRVRRKFDDEVVESDFSPKLKKLNSKGLPITVPTTLPLVPGFPAVVPISTKPKKIIPNVPHRGGSQKKRGRGGISQIVTGSVGQISARRAQGSLPKREAKQQRIASLKGVGRWQPMDDLALITGVLQTNDLSSVYAGVKFSCRFSLEDIHQRWYSLLYDKAISKLAVEYMRQMEPSEILLVQSQTLFSPTEEEAIKQLGASENQPSLEEFEQLISSKPNVFQHSRKPGFLLKHWQTLKQYKLLPDQALPPYASDGQHLSWSDMEEMAENAVTSSSFSSSTHQLLNKEIDVNRQQLHNEMRKIESEVPKLQVLVESVTGIAPHDFDSQTLAILKGRVVRFLMRSREVTIGRMAHNHLVDIDLSLEGPAFKVSRRQASIRWKTSGEFWIMNDGRTPIYVDGKSLFTAQKTTLEHNSKIEISCLSFLFLINQSLINVVRNEATKIFLLKHWQTLKQYKLLPDQALPPYASDGQHLSWSDMEEMAENAVTSSSFSSSTHQLLNKEIDVNRQQLHNEMRKIESEVPKLQVLVESVTGIAPHDFDSQTLAILKGRVVRFLMRSREVTIGRMAHNHLVDIDLSLEGPAFKVSRRQASIRWKTSGEFWIMNDGRTPIYVDGKSLFTAQKTTLEHNSKIEISCLSFLFLINQSLINVVRNEATKMLVA